jgi:hypothetical protein
MQITRIAFASARLAQKLLPEWCHHSTMLVIWKSDAQRRPIFPSIVPHWSECSVAFLHSPGTNYSSVKDVRHKALAGSAIYRQGINTENHKADR